MTTKATITKMGTAFEGAFNNAGEAGEKTLNAGAVLRELTTKAISTLGAENGVEFVRLHCDAQAQAWIADNGKPTCPTKGAGSEPYRAWQNLYYQHVRAPMRSVNVALALLVEDKTIPRAKGTVSCSMKGECTAKELKKGSAGDPVTSVINAVKKIKSPDKAGAIKILQAMVDAGFSPKQMRKLLKNAG